MQRNKRIDPSRKLVLELMQKHRWIEGNTPAAVVARWRVWRELNESYGYSLAATARATESNHTSVLYARNAGWEPNHYKHRRIPINTVIDVCIEHQYDTSNSISIAATQSRWNAWRDLHEKHGYTVNEIAIALDVHRESVYNARLKDFIANRPIPPKNSKGQFNVGLGTSKSSD